jgi:DNA-binding NtrC family response regulator
MSLCVELIGTDPAMAVVRRELEDAARSDAKVLITGESGVGKEVVGRLIHERGARARSPLVTINCAGVADTLLESELFGHVRGSFTDAYRDKPGLCEMADGGTLFLDEVGEMSLRMQALMLRFLEGGEIQRVGSDRPNARVDVRVIAATNSNLSERVGRGSFRHDLYYRLNVIRLAIPALRERPDDVLPLFDHFLRHYATAHASALPELTAQTRRCLVTYRWPGNVRELKNVAERMVVRARGSGGDVSDLPREVRDAAAPAAGDHAYVPAGHTYALYDRMISGGESFWSTIYEPFVARDLTRDDLRAVVCMGLARTTGNYRRLVELFNMAPVDYRRFRSCLRKHQCHVALRHLAASRQQTHRRDDSTEQPTALTHIRTG